LARGGPSGRPRAEQREAFIVSEAWSGRAGFVLAAVASAVGLGSIWKFPYEVGANGGAAFVLFYLTGLALAVVPLLFAEFAIGRRGRGDAVASVEALAAACGAARAWRWAPMIGVAAGTLILSFYSVIGGWTLAYAIETAFAGLSGPAPAQVQARYDALLAGPLRMSAYHAVFLALTAAVVARGVSGGIELASKVLMPLLIVLMLTLAGYSVSHGDAAATWRYLLRFEPQAFTAAAALDALGLGFFSIGVGFGLMITYAAYAGHSIPLRQVALLTVALDTGISLTAGFAVFPVVFAHGLDPATGPGLVFVTLPVAFARMPLGTQAATAFFVLLFVAALASAISMLELAVAFLARRLGWRRTGAVAAVSAFCFAAGLATVLSFNRLAHWTPTPFEFLDHLTSNLMLPIGGFALALFAGWVLPGPSLADELGLGARGAALLRFTLRWVTPALIAAAALAPYVVRAGA
jgi:NSS family neurotransmitter:Na+ symporter